MTGHDIGIALDDYYLSILSNIFLRHIEAIEHL